MDSIIPSNANHNTQNMHFIYRHLVMYISFELMWVWITAYNKKTSVLHF